jgi:tetratricopeptide (TPR) repeat protein
MKPFKLAGLFLAGLLAASSVHAVDTVTSRDAPDLTKVRAAIKAKDYSTAIVDLKGMIDQGVLHADVYSLLGFSYRKTADFKSARVYYAKALEFDADHKGALEYQGEMFVELGQIADARKNLERLVKLCPTGCEERDDLEQALKKAGAAI